MVTEQNVDAEDFIEKAFEKVDSELVKQCLKHST